MSNLDSLTQRACSPFPRRCKTRNYIVSYGSKVRKGTLQQSATHLQLLQEFCLAQVRRPGHAERDVAATSSNGATAGRLLSPLGQR